MRMNETKRMLKTELSKTISQHFHRSRKFMKTLLEMVTTKQNEQQTIISNFLLYLNEMCETNGWEKPYEFTQLKPIISVLAICYLKLKTWLFVEAWTFAISVFNYTKAIREWKRAYDFEYIR